MEYIYIYILDVRSPVSTPLLGEREASRYTGFWQCIYMYLRHLATLKSADKEDEATKTLA